MNRYSRKVLVIVERNIIARMDEFLVAANGSCIFVFIFFVGFSVNSQPFDQLHKSYVKQNSEFCQEQRRKENSRNKFYKSRAVILHQNMEKVKYLYLE